MINKMFLLEDSKNVFLRKLSRIEFLVVHHSGSQHDSIESINEYHKTKFKQGGITYHFVIDKKGDLYQTRPLNHVSSHIKNLNTKSLGVCFLGDYENNRIPFDPKIPFSELLNYVSQYVDKFEVIFHGDKVSTLCPGIHLKNQLNKTIHK